MNTSVLKVGLSADLFNAKREPMFGAAAAHPVLRSGA